VIAGVGQAALRRLLKLPVGAPLLVLRQCRYAESGRPIESRTAFWRADAANVLMELRD
jgi:DNA-binding GntR family transcriptional regulator